MAIDENTFPDEGFRNYLLKTVDLDKNLALSQAEIDCVGKISGLRSYNVRDLTGISVFTSLKELICDQCELTALDVKNGKLSKLTLPAGTTLTSVDCGGNALTDLDLTGCPNLKHLSVSKNQLTNLELSKNTVVEELFVDENSLKTLDISACSKLTSLKCQKNSLTELGIMNNPNLLQAYDEKNKSISDGILIYTLDKDGVVISLQMDQAVKVIFEKSGWKKEGGKYMKSVFANEEMRRNGRTGTIGACLRQLPERDKIRA
ncbi:MAG: leucine-rich repeat domain-containing protein [Eubacterium sp.]|nr:leucine-rich repeat domain-containing protein [Eubacterium sp.]